MNMHEIFSTSEREKLFTYFIYMDGELRTLRGIARELSLSPAQVHKYMKILEREGLAKNGRMVDNEYVRSLRRVVNLQRIEKAGLVGIIRRKVPSSTGIGMFGSWAQGRNTMDSDLDIWVKIKKGIGIEKESELKREIEKKIGVDVDLFLFDNGALQKRRSENAAFFFSIYHSTVLWGERI